MGGVGKFVGRVVFLVGTLVGEIVGPSVTMVPGDTEGAVVGSDVGDLELGDCEGLVVLAGFVDGFFVAAAANEQTSLKNTITTIE